MNAVETRPPWFDPAIPAREDCVLKSMLEARAARHPRSAPRAVRGRQHLDLCASASPTCAPPRRACSASACARAIACSPGCPPAARWCSTWFAANYLGAVFVPLNTAYRGEVLAHVVNAAEASIMVAHHALVPRLEGLALRQLDTSSASAASRRRRPAGLQLLGEARCAAMRPRSTTAWWSSTGTSSRSSTPRAPPGRRRACCRPTCRCYTTALVVYGYLRDGESILVNLPMFHVGGTSSTYAALIRGGGIYLVDGFSTDKFWDQVRDRQRVTTCGLIGVMSAFLAKAEPRPDDGDNPLRCLTMFPIEDFTVRFAQRFGFDYVTGFNMTEVSAPLITDLNTRAFGSCGRPRSGVQVRLVDDHDIEVPRHRGPDDRAQRRPLDDERRLQRPAGGDRGRLAQRLVPHRRPVPPGRGGQLLLRRPHQGHDPAARREHLVVRGRERGLACSRRRRSRRHRRRERDRRDRK